MHEASVTVRPWWASCLISLCVCVCIYPFPQVIRYSGFLSTAESSVSSELTRVWSVGTATDRLMDLLITPEEVCALS